MTFLRAHRFFLLATALWAFGSLAYFAEITPFITSIFLIGFALAASRERLPFKVPDRAWVLISLAALALAFYGFVVLRERLYSVAYLFLYLEINKLWTGSRVRDVMQIYALTFFQVLAASVSTASVLFAPVLFVYMFLLLAGLITATLKRDSELVFDAVSGWGKDPGAPSPNGDTIAERRLRLHGAPYVDGAFLRWVSALLVLVIIIGSVTFVAIPRLQARSFAAGLSGAGQSTTISGFSDMVSFGSAEEIQLDSTIMMRALPVSGYRLTDKKPDPALLRLKGVTLSQYDGRRWSRPTRDGNESVIRGRGVELPKAPIPMKEGPRELETRIIVSPNSTGYLFGPDRTRAMRFEAETPYRYDRFAESVRIVLPNWVNDFSYIAQSQYMPEGVGDTDRATKVRPLPRWGLDGPDSGNVRGLGSRVWEAISFGGGRAGEFVLQKTEFEHYTQLPVQPDMDLVRELAKTWGGEGTRAEEIADAIASRLQKELSYSMQIEFASEEDHLRRFLTVEKAGHCEYFATAMALMCRARGIPARLANGYATDEWIESNGGYFLIRKEHAHSWVEVFISGHGWITWDPTPSSGIGAARSPITFYRRLTQWIDSIKFVWYTSVIDFDTKNQTFMFMAIFRASDVILRPDRMIGRLTGLDGQAIKGFTRNSVVVLGSIGAAVVLAMVGLWLVRLRPKWLVRLGVLNRRSAWKNPAVEYLWLLAELEKRRRREAGETALEYARVWAKAEPVLEEFPGLTERYYETRFNAHAWGAAEAARASDLLRRLRELPRNASSFSVKRP